MSSSSARTGADTEHGQRHRGPSLLGLALVFAGLFIGSLVVVAVMTHGGHFPSPFEPIAATNAFFAGNRDALRYVVPFGLLVAGVAVTGGLSRKLPRWAMWSGLFVASVAELSSLSVALGPAMYLLPIARFTGIVWLIVVGALLPSTRANRTLREAPEPTLRKALEGA